MMNSDRLLKISEAAARLGLARSTLRKWIAHGRLHAVHLGRAVRIPESQIDAVIRLGLPKKSRRICALGIEGRVRDTPRGRIRIARAKARLREWCERTGTPWVPPVEE